MLAQDIAVGTRVLIRFLDSDVYVSRTVSGNRRHRGGDFRAISFTENPGIIFPYPVLYEFIVAVPE